MNNEKFLNKTGLVYYHNKAKTVFASATDLDALEQRVDDIITQGGEPNVIDTIKVNGVEQTVTNKEVDITVPTKVSDLTNDAGFITNTVNNLANYYTKSETYTQTEVDNLISAITTLNIEVVQALPTQDISTTTIYLVPKTTSQTSNAYDEYIYANNSWELIGDTQLDLSNYYNTTNLTAITTAEIDALFA